MSKTLLTLYGFNLAYCERLAADIPDEEMHTQPSPDVNTPAWLLGHLAICTDYALQTLGQPTRLPAEWHAEFGPRSQPQMEKHPYPDKQELLLALREGHAAVAAALESVDLAVLDEPNPLPVKFLKKLLPTKGDLVAHLMATHEAAHLGHLSNWRRQTGRPPLF
ncbi:MAG: DinB family protein [Pirellulales bacterium]|nr:DinB family protein [Pirellulales bacterium]